MSTEPTVAYTLNNGVATLTMNRPAVFNALNTQLHTDLLAALRRAERDPAARCVVLTGAGKAFCSGQDLREIPLEDTATMVAQRLRESYNPLIAKLRSLPKPVIAAVNGVAAGAGLSLALACDLRIAVDNARFVVAFARIGLIPDCGMTYFLPRLIGHARAVELAMTGGELDAATALQWGLVNRVASEAEFAPALHDFASQLARGPALAISLIKRSFGFAYDATLEQMLEYEAQAQQAAAGHPDFAEGVGAFREKRAASFR